MRTPFLIIGAGPTGLSMAAFLHRFGLPFRLLEKEEKASPYSKALGIQARTLEVFDALGLTEILLREGHPVKGVSTYWKGHPLASLSFQQMQSPYPFVLILPQNKTEAILTDYLSRHQIPIERGKQLLHFAQEGAGIRAEVALSSGKREIIEADWLLGCDGAHSIVRHQLGLSFSGEAMPHDFILADFTASLQLSPERLHGFFSRKGILALFPMGKNRWRCISNTRSSCPSLVRAEFEALLSQRAGLSLQIEDLLWTSSFKIHTRLTPKIQEGRVFLLGDAFHVHSPVGGQGMNTGIQDAYNLAWKLALVQRKHASAAILTSYTEERRKNAGKLLKRTEKATHFLEGTSWVIQWIRNLCLPLVFRYLPQKMLAALGQLDIDYRESSLIGKGGGKRSLRLLPYVNYERYVLLHRGKTGKELAPFLSQGLLEEHSWEGDAAFLLLRPDGYVAVRSDTIAPVLDYLNRLFPAGC